MTAKQELKIDTKSRFDMRNINDHVQDAIRNSGVANGVSVVFVPHTTCGITINEAADSSVCRDIMDFVYEAVPQKPEFKHTEGNSNAHIRCSYFGSSINLIIQDGRAILGQWQGIFLCDFDGPRTRKVWIKIVDG